MPDMRSMKLQIYLEDTYRLIKEEPIILILGGLVVQLATILTMGILAGPFLGGYLLLIIYYLRENRKPKFNDIFSGLKQFANLLAYFLVLLTIFIGFMLLILPGLVFATWWLYVLPLMADKKISFSEAMKLSMNKVNETGFLMHLIFLLLITVLPIMLLNFISTMLPFLFVLKILLPPFQAGCLASLYVDQFKEIEDKADDDQKETSAAAKPLIPPSEETASAETGGKTESAAKEQASTEPDDHGQIDEQSAKSETQAAEQQENPSGPESVNFVEESQDDSGKNNTEK